MISKHQPALTTLEKDGKILLNLNGCFMWTAMQSSEETTISLGGPKIHHCLAQMCMLLLTGRDSVVLFIITDKRASILGGLSLT